MSRSSLRLKVIQSVTLWFYFIICSFCLSFFDWIVDENNVPTTISSKAKIFEHWIESSTNCGDLSLTLRWMQRECSTPQLSQIHNQKRNPAGCQPHQRISTTENKIVSTNPAMVLCFETMLDCFPLFFFLWYEYVNEWLNVARSLSWVRTGCSALMSHLSLESRN